MMRILIYGAGVIGSLYAVKFENAGFHVDVYARNRRLHELQSKGLRYRTSTGIAKANVTILEKVSDKRRYEYVILAVRTEQVKEALLELKQINAPTIVTMVNTMENQTSWESLCGKGRILPAFPGAGGGIVDGVLDAKLTPYIIQPTTFGELTGEKSKRLMRFAAILRKSGIPYQIVENMHHWQMSHIAMVVPIADAYYMAKDPSKVYREKKVMLHTAKTMKRNFRYLAYRHKLSPKKFYGVLLLPDIVLAWILKSVYKSDFGDTFMYQHAMKAPEEMKSLHNELYGRLGKKNFHTNRSQIEEQL